MFQTSQNEMLNASLAGSVSSGHLNNRTANLVAVWSFIIFSREWNVLRTCSWSGQILKFSEGKYNENKDKSNQNCNEGNEFLLLSGNSWRFFKKNPNCINQRDWAGVVKKQKNSWLSNVKIKAFDVQQSNKVDMSLFDERFIFFERTISKCIYFISKFTNCKKLFVFRSDSINVSLLSIPDKICITFYNVKIVTHIDWSGFFLKHRRIHASAPHPWAAKMRYIQSILIQNNSEREQVLLRSGGVSSELITFLHDSAMYDLVFFFWCCEGYTLPEKLAV